MQILDYLEQLGLTEIESKLYYTLLTTGPVTVRDLAKEIKIKRTTAYLYVDHLIDKGLVMKMVKGSTKLVAAQQPEENLHNLVEKKLSQAQKTEEQFPSMLSLLTKAMPQDAGTTEAEIKYYKGKVGVKKIYEEALQAHELRTYFNIELIKEALPTNEFLFVDALKNNKKIKIFELLQDTPKSRKKAEASNAISANYKNYSYKFLPTGVRLSAADILIYDGNVGIINVGKQFTGIILKNRDYFNNSKELFDLIWKIIPDVNS